MTKKDFELSRKLKQHFLQNFPNKLRFELIKNTQLDILKVNLQVICDFFTNLTVKIENICIIK